jgi:hypothetical protein
MDFSADTLLLHFLRTFRDPFTAKEMCRFLHQVGIRASIKEVADYLESDPLVFPLEHKLYLTRAGAFTGQFFSFVPTPQEIAQQVIVHLNVDAREYNGRYFNDIEAWKVERPGQVQQPMQGYAPQQGYQPMAQMPPVQQQAMPQQGYQAPVAGQQQFPPQQPQPAQPQQQGLPFPPAQ